ncbi:MAG TPA: ATP-binding protein, partial [Myxococcota bacterium]|nr:ATP-binding protein [Myxococcota bacterium]
NLFLNAREALRGARDGRILAESRVAEGWIEVDVSDNGPGISEAVRDRIFDPFFTTRPPNEGTGLGLPIAFDIVREHGGSLELDPSFQAGARFVVRLPMGSGAGHPGPSEQRAEPQVASPEES